MTQTSETTDALQAAMAAIEEEFLASAERELGDLRDASIALRAEPDRAEVALERIEALAHDLKGQFGAFGFDAMGAAAESLHIYVRRGAAGSRADVVDLHLETLSTFFSARLKGPGGPDALAALDRLAAVSR